MFIQILSGVYLHLPSDSHLELLYIYAVFKGWGHIKHAISVETLKLAFGAI